MKHRNGFVSNSSSSSFIIGIAKVDVGAPCDFIVSREVLSKLKLKWELDFTENNGEYTIDVVSFNGDYVSCKATDGDRIIYMYECEGADSDFWEEDKGYYNYYKIELSDFSKENIEKYEKILALGGEASYGAGRNG